MGFIKNDYLERQKKIHEIRKFAVFGLILAIAVGIIWYSFAKKQGGDIVVSPITPTDIQPVVVKEKDLPTLVNDVKSGIVAILTYDKDGNPLGQGSGFFINTQGHIVSNRHVFRGARRVEVKLAADVYQVDKVLADDTDNDLILFSIKSGSRGFTALPLASKKPMVGERAVVIGNPLGLEATVSDGIVSAQRELEKGVTVLQVTSPISPGSSGSPVLNMRGEVIGVATFQLREGQNLNFAIPVALVKKLAPTGATGATGGGKIENLSFADLNIPVGADAYSRGLMYYNAKEYNLAIPEFQKAIEKEPANAELYFYLGMCCKEEHNTAAVEAFQKAIDLKPDYIDAYVNLGVVYVNLSMYQKAAEVLREAVKLDPNDAEALLKLGLAYAMAKEYRAAVRVLEKAADINMDAKAYYALGISYVGLNMYSEGIKALDSSLDLDPELLESYVALGYALIGVKNWSRGIEMMNRAVVLDPQNPHVRYLLGFMYLGLKNTDAAERQYQILSQLTDKDASKLSADLGNAISRVKQSYSGW